MRDDDTGGGEDLRHRDAQSRVIRWPRCFRERAETTYASTIRGLQFNFVVRAKHGEVGSLESVIRRDARAMNPRGPLSDVWTLQRIVDEDVRGPRFHAFLLSLFGSWGRLRFLDFAVSRLRSQ